MSAAICPHVEQSIWCAQQAKKQFRSNVRLKAADVIRKKSHVVYTRCVDLSVNSDNPVTVETLLAGEDLQMLHPMQALTMATCLLY